MKAQVRQIPRRRILIVSSCDSLAEISYMEILEDPGIEVVGIVWTRFRWSTKFRILRRAWEKSSLYYAIYMCAEIWGARLVGLLGNLRRRRAGITPWVRLLASSRRSGIPVVSTFDVNSSNVIDYIREMGPDLVLSIRPGVIFGSDFIEAAPPVLNVHHSALPDYRGIGSVFQALAAGESGLASSVHQITSEKIDSGPVIRQERLRRIHKESVFSHTIRLAFLAKNMLPKCLLSLENHGDCCGEPVNDCETKGSYYSWPGPGPLSRLREQGVGLVNWRDLWSDYTESGGEA